MTLGRPTPSKHRHRPVDDRPLEIRNRFGDQSLGHRYLKPRERVVDNLLGQPAVEGDRGGQVTQPITMLCVERSDIEHRLRAQPATAISVGQERIMPRPLDHRINLHIPT